MFLTVLLLAATFLWDYFTEMSAWAAMEGRTRSLVEQEERRDRRRPVLRGIPQPGNAWEDYDAALDALVGIRSTQVSDGAYARTLPDADRKQVRAALLCKFGSALDNLRKGAGREISRWTGDHEYRSELLIGLGICRSLQLQEVEEWRGAAEVLLDVCQFARDHEDQETEYLMRPLEALKDLLVCARLKPEEGLEIERELRVLEDALPPWSERLEHRLAEVGTTLLRRDADLSSLLESSDTRSFGPWSHRFFFGRKSRIEAFQALEKRTRVMIASSRGPWESEKKLIDAWIEEYNRADSPLVRGSMPNSYPIDWRERLAQLRILRGAAHYRATGQILELQDPFGTTLLHEVRGDTLTLRSLGFEGLGDLPRKGWRGFNAVEGIELKIPR